MDLCLVVICLGMYVHARGTKGDEGAYPCIPMHVCMGMHAHVRYQIYILYNVKYS